MSDLEVSLRLTADGGAFVGTVKVARAELVGVGETAKRAAGAAGGMIAAAELMQQAANTPQTVNVNVEHAACRHGE